MKKRYIVTCWSKRKVLLLTFKSLKIANLVMNLKFWRVAKITEEVKNNDEWIIGKCIAYRRIES